MRRFRAIKRQARRQLHDMLSDPVWYFPAPDADPVATTVRVHLAFEVLGDLAGGGWAERQEVSPRIVFLLADVDPQRGGIVVTEDLGAYRVDNDLPADDLTVSAEVVRLTPGQVEQELGLTPGVAWLGLTSPESDD